jgi:hypothetical protein
MLYTVPYCTQSTRGSNPHVSTRVDAVCTFALSLSITQETISTLLLISPQVPSFTTVRRMASNPLSSPVLTTSLCIQGPLLITVPNEFSVRSATPCHYWSQPVLCAVRNPIVGAVDAESKGNLALQLTRQDILDRDDPAIAAQRWQDLAKAGPTTLSLSLPQPIQSSSSVVTQLILSCTSTHPQCSRSACECCWIHPHPPHRSLPVLCPYLLL